MAVVSELIRQEGNAISFGDYSKTEKTKLEMGDYKVKTFREITRLEKGGEFVYESTPGTAVTNYVSGNGSVSFSVEGLEDAEITVGMDPETEYEVSVADRVIGTLKSNLGGKLTFSVELEPETETKVSIRKA